MKDAKPTAGFRTKYEQCFNNELVFQITIPVDGNILREKALEIVASNDMDDDDNADEECLRVAEDVSGVKFSD
ncbi:hypothetical protein NPIL_413381 [Nephila pilipes]|uniref:Uncharacterized protein n=1 Tax=Nephila pilipes TaxID=299642 RepID=A0A8X6QFQ2_NEPPI|nr:hypothetical protein NPIL_413381 [Nephila pilipes]